MFSESPSLRIVNLKQTMQRRRWVWMRGLYPQTVRPLSFHQRVPPSWIAAVHGGGVAFGMLSASDRDHCAVALFLRFIRATITTCSTLTALIKSTFLERISVQQFKRSLQLKCGLSLTTAPPKKKKSEKMVVIPNCVTVRDDETHTHKHTVSTFVSELRTTLSLFQFI